MTGHLKLTQEPAFAKDSIKRAARVARQPPDLARSMLFAAQHPTRMRYS
ncbi:hypothetical protein [Acidovorax sp. BL-A-41-H1]